MKKNFVIRVFSVISVTFIIGLVLILSAPSIGRHAGDRAVRNNGGGMETSQFYWIVDETTTSYRMTGLVISLVSGFGMITSSYALYKEM